MKSIASNRFQRIRLLRGRSRWCPFDPGAGPSASRGRASREPFLEHFQVLLEAGGHLPGIAQVVFVVLADRAAIGRRLEPVEEGATHHALAERTPRVFPAG